jgi:hypothetical protein
MMPARLKNAIDQRLRRFVRTRVRTSAPIGQARALLVAVDPFVGGFPADVEAIGELGDRLQAAQVIGNELRPLIHE